MDRRDRKTKKLLRDTLVKMMRKQDFRKITVSSLTANCDLNRGTFYLHYLDIYDMLEKIESEIITNLNEIINKHKDKLINNDYKDLLIEIAEYVKKDKELFKSILGDSGDISFLHRLKKEMMVTFINNCSKTFRRVTNIDTLKAAGSFIISGGIGVFQDWINSDCKSSSDILIKELYTLFTYSIRS